MDKQSQAARGSTSAHAAARLALLAGALALAGCASVQPGRAIHIATASTSHTVCSGVFVSGRDPDEIYREEVRPAPGMVLIDWALRYRLDRERREVKTWVAGLFEAHAVYRDGLGCLVVHGEMPPDPPSGADLRPAPATRPALLDDIAGAGVVLAKDARIRTAVDEAFAEPHSSFSRRTKAVVVVHRGRVIAERYAPGIDARTPMQGHSVAKSVIHALIGILVRQGKLSPTDRAPVAEWDSPGDPRRDITIEQLLRMSSGLPWDEYAGGWDPATRMWFVERDKYAFAARGELEAAPGTRWNYSDRGYMVLSRIVRDAAGGSAADVLGFAHRELFGPLGMQDVTLEFDATGTPLGTSHMYASARDWARFGLLYLNDGVVGGRRVDLATEKRIPC
jgi:CubicO group peptidase (beta-lactamase class C family)